MIAIIRIRNETSSYELCELDLMKFSEEQVRERMSERGIKDDTFFVYGFSDWGVDTQMNLQVAYMLKKLIVEVYEGDDDIVKYWLQSHRKPLELFHVYWEFISKSEEDAMFEIFNRLNKETVITMFCVEKSLANVARSLISQSRILKTDKGFYYSEH
ncbi:hypothetical protein [Streptococcus sp. zg-JUN1979]|uniref:hypothetical protein n=1 Tax=Streptococcus sp. zg-JUN1979 TaxID=3391450 RepID=UPI0039A61CAC